MKSIKAIELMFKLNIENPSFKLVSTLEPNQFSKLYIPNSININKREDILERLDKQDEIKYRFNSFQHWLNQFNAPIDGIQ